MTDTSDSGFVRRAVMRLGEWLPYIGIVTVTVAFLVVTGLGRIDISSRGLYLVLPIILASLWLIRAKKRSRMELKEDAALLTLSDARFMHLTLLNALILIGSIVLLLMSETRPPAYFVLMMAVSGVVLLQILGMKGGSGWQKGVILTSLVLLGLNLTWSITLKYPLYVGYTDIAAHLVFIDSILESSHVTAAMTGGYQYFPLYHIFFASGIEIMGTGVRDGFFLLAALAYIAAIPFSYLIFRALTGNERLSLIACLLLAVNAEFVFYGGYMVTRALAFVLFVIILYLLFRQPRSKSLVAILGLVTIALVLTHQTTLVYVTGILALFVWLWWLLGRGDRSFGPQVRFASVYLTVFVLAFMSYWFVGAPDFAQGVFGRLPGMITPPPVENGAPPDVTQPPDGLEPPDMTVPDRPSFAVHVRERVPDVVFLFFSWPGFAYLLRKGRDKKDSKLTAIALLGLVVSLLYLPGLNHLLPRLNNILLMGRLPLLLTVFMSLIMAFGVAVLASGLAHERSMLARRAAVPLLMILLVAFSFFSMSGSKNASDVPEFRNPYFGQRHYYTMGELTAFSFVREDTLSDMTVYSDYLAARYFVDRSASIIADPDVGYIEEGAVVLRTRELSERWLLFSGGVAGWGGVLYKYTLEGAEPADNILEYLSMEHRVYDNVSTEVYMIFASDDEDAID